ncbi:D-Ala-D-Ala carboxypeptidase family metallohydrolase [Paracoccus amoyensis]|uniref:D-Ala-D-Ala carboxypeptidase family metallohydrolase n=1 Tax=Paracoccus amoyensis TaxID=2760093 RepID=UPI001FE949BF|nr:D-Ala-D-Ala carboxypeptidase family metallohydrolase [Paracoccus amoyensis]
MTNTFHSHWRDVPEGTWRWPNFSPAEIACRGTGKLLINEPALDKLQALRDRLGKPLIVRSAYRSPEHNRTVGGATRSKHLDGAAFDIAMPSSRLASTHRSRSTLIRSVVKVPFQGAWKTWQAACSQ